MGQRLAQELAAAYFARHAATNAVITIDGQSVQFTAEVEAAFRPDLASSWCGR